MTAARDEVVAWWDRAYLGDDALRPRFLREAGAALPVFPAEDATAIYDVLDW